MIDFPINPSLNQVFTSPAGKKWKWNGVKWGGFGSESLVALSAVDSSTIDLSWGSSTRTLSGDINNQSITNSKLAFDGGSFAFRNKIINGNFDIWQRGTSFTGIGVGTFTADRWTTSSPTASLNKNISRQTLTDTDLPATEAGLKYFLRGSYTSGSGIQEWAICNPIELTSTGSTSPFKVGKTYTLSYYARCASSSNIGINIQCRDASNSVVNAISVGGAGRPITTSWTRYTYTFTMVAPNATNTSLCVIFVNDVIPANTNIDITGVQLEEGSVATPFENRPIGTELALCQRYFEKNYNLNTPPATPLVGYDIQTNGVPTANTFNNFRYNFSVKFQTRKRSNPAVIVYATDSGIGGNFSLGTPGSRVNIGVVVGACNEIGFHTATVTNSVQSDAFLNFTASAEL